MRLFLDSNLYSQHRKNNLPLERQSHHQSISTLLTEIKHQSMQCSGTWFVYKNIHSKRKERERRLHYKKTIATVSIMRNHAHQITGNSFQCRLIDKKWRRNSDNKQRKFIWKQSNTCSTNVLKTKDDGIPSHSNSCYNCRMPDQKFK